METKLTLKLDKEIIDHAKLYAKEHNVSLSKLIESYLNVVINRDRKKMNISPLVKSLTGVVDLKDNDYKKGYTDFISKKYS